MSKPVHMLGIAGSLRCGSYNRAALRAATQLVPEDATIDIFELDGIPAFNQDEEQNPPAKVVELKARIREADAVLIVTPEYNYSVPGVLKNAIDWASRPYGDNAWSGKPAAVMGASVGTIGTARAQYQLRQMFVFLNIFPVNQPEVMIGNAADRFDVAPASPATSPSQCALRSSLGDRVASRLDIYPLRYARPTRERPSSWGSAGAVRALS
jgi:chromate reductase, NAD(P)H dehydrogenase (quinone)